MEFFDGATSLGTFPLNGSGQASFTTSTLTVATHSITAKYLGNGNYNESTSSALNQEVQKADTTTARGLLGPTRQCFNGQSVTFTATVTSGRHRRRRADGDGDVQGRGDHHPGTRDAPTPAGQATLHHLHPVGGQPTRSRPSNGGSGNHNGEPSGGAEPGGGSEAATTTARASSVNPSVFGQSVTFTATVTASRPGRDADGHGRRSRTARDRGDRAR